MRFGYWLPGLRRLAPQRRRRADGRDLVVREPAGAAERGDRVRPHPGGRAQPQRHQGRSTRRRSMPGAPRRRSPRSPTGSRSWSRCARRSTIPRCWPSRPPTSTTSATDGSRSTWSRRGGRRRRSSTACSSTSTTTATRAPRSGCEVARRRVEPAARSRTRAGSTRSRRHMLEPKPVRKPRPMVYAGGESPAAKDLISRTCDGYLMHGDPRGADRARRSRTCSARRDALASADALRRGRLRGRAVPPKRKRAARSSGSPT